MFIETSALANSNVKDAFENLLQEIYTQRQKVPNKSSLNRNPLILDTQEGSTHGNGTNQSKSYCC